MKWFVPRRLEVLGKHTDYAGGRSLLAAVDRGITLTLEDADSGIIASTTALPGELTLAPGVTPDLPAGHWGLYVQAVLDRLHLNFGDLRPARITIDSNLPLASGMSSSSALVVAVALALADHNGLRHREEWTSNIHDDIDLAGYMATMENGLTFGTLEGFRGVGTFGGSEGPHGHAVLLGRHLTEFVLPHRRTHLRSARRRGGPSSWPCRVCLPKDRVGAGVYNNASLRARELTAAWNSATGRDDAVLADALASVRMPSKVFGPSQSTTRRCPTA